MAKLKHESKEQQREVRRSQRTAQELSHSQRKSKADRPKRNRRGKKKSHKKSKKKLMRILLKENLSGVLSPTSNRPTHALNRLDRTDFKNFTKKLKEQKYQLNSTVLSDWNSPKPRIVLTANCANLIQTPNRHFSNISAQSTLEEGEIRTLLAENYDDEEMKDIIIDDTTITEAMPEPSAMDQSVIFVSETRPNCVPLISDNNNVAKPLRVLPPLTPKNKLSRNSLFSNSEKKQLRSYNVNAYNPNAELQVRQRRKNPKRMVIIDGSNVAFAHGRRETFSVKGLQICIEYFRKMGHEVKAVLPLYRLHKMKSTDPEALEEMHKRGLIVLTPCKNLPGLSATCYDDRFILQLASELDAAIVSNDNYRDLIHENTAFKKLIERRVIGYTWCDDVFMLPKDPYGQFGPTLHSILNREV